MDFNIYSHIVYVHELYKSNLNNLFIGKLDEIQTVLEIDGLRF